ncbi:mitochondrial large subunit ribosomal protein-domain-containing protein [Gaertneriomyces semiglobifer]|nr:mitochondrial large subunit ribosomal protein-domain-containing protein [Gaertneriomyces semiglobifer]
MSSFAFSSCLWRCARSQSLPSIRSTPLCLQLTITRSYRGEVLGKRPKPTITKTHVVGNPNKALPEGFSKESLAYSVKRTAEAGWLPVYKQTKAGGSQLLTRIRRIEGDIQTLAEDLKQFVPPQNIKVKMPQKHIVLKGDYVTHVRDWLTTRGF